MISQDIVNLYKTSTNILNLLKLTKIEIKSHFTVNDIKSIKYFIVDLSFKMFSHFYYKQKKFSLSK